MTVSDWKKEKALRFDQTEELQEECYEIRSLSGCVFHLDLNVRKKMSSLANVI